MSEIQARDLIERALQRGATIGEIAEMLGCHQTTIWRWRQGEKISRAYWKLIQLQLGRRHR